LDLKTGVYFYTAPFYFKTKNFILPVAEIALLILRPLSCYSFFKLKRMNPEGTAQTLTPEPSVSVYQIVSKLIASLQPLAVKRNNILLNDIPRDLSVNADQNTIAYVLSQLVNSAVNSTENQCIHIEAVFNNEHQMLRVKDLNTHIYHTMEITS